MAAQAETALQQGAGSIPDRPLRFKPLWRYETRSYAQCPTPIVLGENVVRVYFSERDHNNKSYVSYVTLDLDHERPCIAAHAPRVLAAGPLAAFDADGVIPSYAYRKRGDITLLYSGWSALASGAYQNSIGEAVFEGDTYRLRRRSGPLMDRTKDHPYLCVTPCLDESGLRMWYVDGLRWEVVNGRPEPIYRIACAELDDPQGSWWRDDEMVLDAGSEMVCHSRPWVTTLPDWSFEMLYSERLAVDYRDGANAYRIRRAVSEDGFRWTHTEDPIIERTPGFDDKMQAYLATFDTGGKRYALWNGDSFGKGGFALGVEV